MHRDCIICGRIVGEWKKWSWIIAAALMNWRRWIAGIPRRDKGTQKRVTQSEQSVIDKWNAALKGLLRERIMNAYTDLYLVHKAYLRNDSYWDGWMIDGRTRAERVYRAYMRNASEARKKLGQSYKNSHQNKWQCRRTFSQPGRRKLPS